MFHKDQLGQHASQFPSDRRGYVPEPGDHWSEMEFDYGLHNPNEPGIDAEERARRIEYLDNQWWPKVIAAAHEQRETLHGDAPIKQWRQRVVPAPPLQHGFEVEEIG